jgi:RimJ/RimL family protein N-acetyltransferase
MKRLMIEHAFHHVSRVAFLVGPGNRRSQRAAEKIGGVRVGRRKNSLGRDAVLCELTPERFAAWKAATEVPPAR